MNTITILELVLCMILFCLISEFFASIVGKKYVKYSSPNELYSFWAWIHYDWNYVGGCKPVRHDGVRWFGFEFERTEEIPMGELRF